MTMHLAAAPEPVDGLAGWAVDLMASLGGPGAAVIVGLDNLFPPIPSEIVLPLAGFSASQGTFSLAGALLWTTVGSVLGAILVYYLGALLGRERTRAIVVRIPLVKVGDFDRTEAWFARHGAKAVFLGRMVPLFRSFISLPAGIERMPVWRFLGLTTLGSLLWNTIFVVAGYTLGENWHLVEDYSGIVQKVVIGAVVLAVAGFVVIRLRDRRHGDGRHDTEATRPIRSGKGRSPRR
ncbi:DedA family protein [Amycolatopsis cihanbeyliensis]|uniref:Membrane protein DedA with SNARE-associated domain n=1 Tax=Amycolatopsis cihanbeyliensis TaxID=1128664 RepID=A0A542DJH5_AMYCI|nr:DedA family protein [Amycolatopsis cihanbeyliensis]TQJ03248.1 membrane protein DedA with SNARE-associated domain [Amycolatopsis cihanbeyliensis]